MSWLGTIIGCPVAGDVQLLDDIIKLLLSAWDFKVNGICIPIWSPSKSALKALHTNGCNFIALPFVNLGWNACIPSLCNVGALFSNIG